MRFKITEILTLVIAIWGAALSSWIYFEQSKEATPRIYVRMDVHAVGFDKDNKPVGDIQVLFSNVGKSNVSIAPRIDILSFDSKSGKAFRAEASFIRETRQGHTLISDYIIDNKSWYNNQEIVSRYSSISRRASLVKSKISKENEMNTQLKKLNHSRGFRFVT